jgi:hypothetical protein
VSPAFEGGRFVFPPFGHLVPSHPQTVIRVYGHDADAGLVVGLHEPAAADVEEDLANLRRSDGGDRAVALGRGGGANGAAWHLGVERLRVRKVVVLRFYRYVIYFRLNLRSISSEISRLKS